jgi:hypothetical protein
MGHTLGIKHHHHDMSCLKGVHKFPLCHFPTAWRSGLFVANSPKSSQRTKKYLMHLSFIIAFSKSVKGISWFSTLSSNLILKDYVTEKSNSFLEECYWNLKLALETNIADWLYRLVLRTI